jgi:hypothetical protein
MVMKTRGLMKWLMERMHPREEALMGGGDAP